ncbi:C2 domain-containing protein 3-like [Mizuhopecten yessoensis]|uniref:C2 domain-containing protein 3 n=1 Tax=Mizuhopecten yessoensis TaxID=6573 RepID=A0A210QQZ6_MIZYE|nr:C2 domain-containing protein 3-like [Mizuhopecten yessoensis]OWF51153.1 C2 domain-containing protein 3 [Mizuhopecten yessoensis]
MVKKKAKSSKSAKRRGSWQMEDVQVHTGLPPQVDGQLRCFCRLTIDQIHWHSPNPPDVAHVRVKWWGEDGDGGLFRPLNVKKGDKGPAKVTARYPVRSGPRQFASYLVDMGSLVVEILSGPTMIPVGQAEITQIGLLSNVRPIDGLYPVLSPREEKLAEIHASLVLESLMASYDSTGSIPTTDISMETHATQESMYPQRVQPIPHSQAPQKPVDDPFVSPASHQNGLQNGYADRSEDLRKQLNYSLQETEERQLSGIQSGSTVAITTNGDVVTTNLGQDLQSSPQNHLAGRHSQSDLLSVLLDRGNKLRDQMIISSVDEAEPQTGVKQTYMSCGEEEQGNNYTGMSERRSSMGSLLKEILKAERGTADVSQTDYDPVDLVFGNQLTDNLQVLKMMGGSPRSSVSQDLDLMSDPGDPVHSESILQELFYKNPDSEVSELSELSGDENPAPFKQQNGELHTSMEDPANVRPPSRRSSVSSLSLEFPEYLPSEEVEVKKKKKRKEEASTKVPKRRSRVKTKVKGGKKRRRSRSSARSSASEASDSELMTARSEMSQVSFDMPASDLDEPEEDKPVRRKRVDGLSVERLTLLGRVHVARVIIDALHLAGAQDLNSSKRKNKAGGKPPKPSPKAKKSVTYFIEYQFPVVATSRDKYSPNAMATEVMRVASKNLKDGVVSFNHRSVFPIMFDGSAVEKWWKSALIFKLFSRTAGQKVPTLVGSCGIPLKSILRSDNLQVGRELEIRESGRNSSINSSLRGSLDTFYGSLKVSIELASDSKDFSSALARAKLAEMSGRAKFVPIPQTVPPPPPPPVQLDKPPLPPDFIPSAQNTQLSSTVLPNYTSHVNTDTQTASLGPQLPAPGLPQPPYLEPYHMASQANAEAMTLHTLLLIPEGHNISLQGIPSLSSIKRHPVFPPQPHTLSSEGMKSRDMNTRNTYLVCRMFWCNDAVHSNVCWGTFEPQFNFGQIAPVLLSGSLLERMRNNFMVVEVWDKKTSAENDQLIGIVKLSLHQFYMSFRDNKISNALLKSQYPVISVDNYLPIVDPMSGSQFGQLKVLLAMGSGEQVTELQQLKLDGPMVRPPERPQHFLEREDMMRQGSLAPVYSQPRADNSVEHIFEVVIEGIRGLALFDNMIWGEADCFIQYHFPVQPPSDQPGTGPANDGIPSMKSFRSATTLCIPDPTFNDITRHRIVLSQGTPVQRQLLTACAGAGGGSGGVPFEVWCRYYHPNIRDQCIAKASLPLAKLCAMVTMQKRGESSVQSFALPLKQVAVDTEFSDARAKSQVKESGLMDVTIHYKTQNIQSEQNQAANKNLSGAQICISVGVIRASGLKAAAEAIARLDSGMQYPAEVGVNTYIKIRMSFLPTEDERITRTIARTFAPEFSHHMDFPCPLLWTEADNDALALAEILETAELTLEMWHQVPGLSSDLDRQIAQQTTHEVQGRRLVEKTQDVLLGTATLSLAGLLTNRTGINGWFAVNLPLIGWRQDASQAEDEEDRTVPCNQGLERVVGGVELSVKFAHHNDRDRVVHAARGVGWSPVDLDVEDEEDWQSDDEGCGQYHQITVCMDQVSFPIQNALIAGQTNLDKTARCYIRYKVYDRSAVVSRSVKCRILDTGYILSHCDHKHEFQIPISSPFKWYLREEKLEVQVWVSYGKKDGNQKSQHRDKLIGTTYIELDALNDERRRQHRISGMFPLYKPGAASLGGAFLRAHITAKPQFGSVTKQSDDEADEKVSEGEVDEEYDPNDSFHQIMGKKKSKSSTDVPHLERVEEDSVVPHFPVIVSVERAMHLPLISDKNRSEEYFPNTYVSYQTSESASPAYTQVFYNSDNPVWDDQQETRLSTELLYQENKNLVFKVWHKPQSASKDPDKSSDRVLGFVSVDLTPLTSGLLQICGWYNVMDFHGQCRGQIKVNIVPQDDVTRHVQGISGQPVAMSFYNQPSSLPFTINSSVQNTMPSEQPMSLPTDLRPFSSNLPNFDQVREHQEQLQHQLSENIRQFLRNHEMSSQDSPEESPRPEVSPHWQPPTLNDIRVDDSAACSRSIMFSSLRKQMQDLDDITSKLKKKLASPPSVNNFSIHQGRSEFPDTDNMRNAPIQSIISPLSTLQLTSTLRANDSELLLTGSHEGESSRTAVDSGAFSVTQSSEKYQDALDSQRSSERMDTLRMGITPRDFDNTGQDGPTPREAQKSSGSTPRDAHNFSDTGIHMGYTPRDDVSVSTGGFNMANTPRDLVSVDGLKPCGLDLSQDSNANARDMHVSGSSSASLGFAYQGELSQGSSTGSGYRNGVGAPARTTSTATHDTDVKEMSVIQEFTENEEDAVSDDNGEEDERYYQEYCDILDEQENEDESDNEEENVVVPRTLNDVSGKFGGIPGHSVYMDSNGHGGSPREFVRNGQTMPFDIRASDSRELSRTKFDRKEADNMLDLSDSESVPDQLLSPHLQLTERPSFIEKDSWFSDDDQKDQRVSRFGSDAGEGTHRDIHSPYRVNGDVARNSLLQDVELESVNSGSHNTQNSGSRQSSRVSSAGSDRLSAKNSSGHSRGYESNFVEDDVPLSSSVPKSPKEAFSEVVTELEDFFDPVRPQTRMEGQRSMSPTYGSRSRSPKMLNERVNFESSESFGDPDNATSNINGYGSLPDGEIHDLPNGFQEHSSMPNFFLPSQHLAESMQALQQATSGFPSSSQQQTDPGRQAAKVQAASDLMEKLTTNNHKVKFSTVHTKGRQPPTAAETKRIAKIFSEKFSSKH